MVDKILFKKVLNPFNVSTWEGGRKHPVFFVIKVDHLRGNKHPYFSICGDYINGGGQCIDDFVDNKNVSFNEGWNEDLYLELIDFWKKYHLRSMDEGSDKFKEVVEWAKKFPESKDTKRHIYFNGR